MVPQTLNDWTLESLKQLISSGMRENEFFDFKEMLPRDDEGKSRLREACVAFANSEGGFLVFGVKDRASTDSDSRIVGIDPSIEFFEHFGNFPRNCSPSIDFTPKNPPIALPSGQLVHIIQIPKSMRAPHATKGLGKRHGFRFIKRTSKGDEEMSFEEVSAMFLGRYEKLLKLQLVKSELLTLSALARQSINQRRLNHKTHYSLTGFDTSLLQALTAETIALTATSPIIFSQVQIIRKNATEANRATDVIIPVVNLAVSDKELMLTNYNRQLDYSCKMIELACQTALEALEPLLS